MFVGGGLLERLEIAKVAEFVFFVDRGRDCRGAFSHGRHIAIFYSCIPSVVGGTLELNRIAKVIESTTVILQYDGVIFSSDDVDRVSVRCLWKCFEIAKAVIVSRAEIYRGLFCWGLIESWKAGEIIYTFDFRISRFGNSVHISHRLGRGLYW